ncbi:exported protein of unknown function (plasmid) [Carnobacterium divergens]|nr:exported protein of unknown function [Carnobacterium divergens]
MVKIIVHQKAILIGMLILISGARSSMIPAAIIVKKVTNLISNPSIFNAERQLWSFRALI